MKGKLKTIGKQKKIMKNFMVLLIFNFNFDVITMISSS